MNYRILVRQAALKELEKLPEHVRQRIWAAITSLATNPRPPGCKKLKDREGWRIRVGDYRVIYEVDDNDRVAVVLRIAHRGEVYR